MKLKRKLLSFFTAIIILFCFMPSTVQAANANKAITKQINTYFKYVKQYDHVKISNMVQAKSTVPYIKNAYFQKNIAYIQKKSLQYRIDKISVNGKKAKVKVSVLYYSGYDSLSSTIKSQTWDAIRAKKKLNSDAFINSLATTLKKDFKVAYKNHKATWKYLNKHPEEIEDYGYRVTDTFSYEYAEISDLYTYSSYTIPMVKSGGTWKIQKMTKKMRNSYDCDSYYTINDFSKNPYSYLF